MTGPGDLVDLHNHLIPGVDDGAHGLKLDSNVNKQRVANLVNAIFSLQHDPDRSQSIG